LIFSDHIEEIIESKSSKNGIFAVSSDVEINEILQNDLDDMFSQLQIDTHPLCTEPLQKMLQIVLQINPVIRMQHIEKLLYTYE